MQLRIYLVLIALAPAGVGWAQTIQLPSFSSFSVDTSVLVPDSGAAVIAGNRRASSATASFGGIPRQRALATNRQAAAAQVRATIHDPQEADEAVLRQAKELRASQGPRESAANSTPARTGGDPGLSSVAEIERQRAAQAGKQQQEVLSLLQKGRSALAAGKLNVATVYYRMAANRATGTLKQEIDAERAAIHGHAKEDHERPHSGVAR